MKTLNICRLNENAKFPTRAHPNDAGLDLYALDGIQLSPHQTKVVLIGIAVSIEPGYVGKIEMRSSLGCRGISVLGGVVDAGYTGEVGVILCNNTEGIQFINAGDKIAQLVVYPISLPKLNEVAFFDNTEERGKKGFGSTGT